MKLENLENIIDAAFEDAGALTPDTQGDVRDAVDAALDLLDAGTARVAEKICLLYTSPSPRDPKTSRMPSSA